MRGLMRHRFILTLLATSMVTLFVLAGTGAAGGKTAAQKGGEIAANLLAGRGFAVRFLGADGRNGVDLLGRIERQGVRRREVRLLHGRDESARHQARRNRR